MQTLADRARKLFSELGDLGTEERIEAVNEIKQALHEHSPTKDHPTDCVIWVNPEYVQANDYNPNVVAAPEMKLLKKSIESDGYTMPIVVWPVSDTHYEIIDGFHRNIVGQEHPQVQESTHGRLPVSILQNTARDNRMAATIRHNRARGKHTVDGMSDIVLDLARRNWTDEKIGKELGMEPDEVLRLRQISGLAEMFRDEEFSEAWEAE